jgi:hypothetical protein
MKSLSAVECQEWFSRFGVTIIGNHDLSFDNDVKGDRRTALGEVPKDPVRLAYFAAALISWLPRGRERMLWLKNWHTYPSDHMTFFEIVRAGCGEARHIKQAPGHIFESTAYDDYERRTRRDEEEEAIMSGLVVLIMCFDWETYLLAQNCDDYVYVGDNHVLFSSKNQRRIDEASELMRRFQRAQ